MARLWQGGHCRIERKDQGEHTVWPPKLSAISKHRPGCCRLCLLFQRCALIILQGPFFFGPPADVTPEHCLCEAMSFGDVQGRALVSVVGMKPTNQRTH